MTSAGQGVLDIGTPPTDTPLTGDGHTADLPESFDAWATARWPAFVRFARLVTARPHDAEDAVQDALVGAYSRWTGLRAAGTAEAYVRRSIVNGTISRWRKHGRREDLLADAAGDDHQRQHQPDLAVTISDATVAWQLCQQLPATQRAAVVLRYYEDLPYAEIADALGCAEATARSHVHRALTALRALLPEDETDA